MTCRADRWKGTPRFDGVHGPHLFTYGPNGMYTGNCAGSTERCQANHRHYGRCLLWRCGCSCENPDREETTMIPGEHEEAFLDSGAVQQRELTERLHSTTDAMVWATEFCKTLAGKLINEVDEDTPMHSVVGPGTMVGWFANAMEIAKAEGRKEMCVHLDVFTITEDMACCRTCGALNPERGGERYQRLAEAYIEATNPGIDMDEVRRQRKDKVWQQPAQGWQRDCTCPRIRVGMKTTEQRNLSPDCPVHGEQARQAEDRLFGRDR